MASRERGSSTKDHQNDTLQCVQMLRLWRMISLRLQTLSIGQCEATAGRIIFAGYIGHYFCRIFRNRGADGCVGCGRTTDVQSFGGRNAEFCSPVKKKGMAYEEIDIFAAIQSSSVNRQASAKSPAQEAVSGERKSPPTTREAPWATRGRSHKRFAEPEKYRQRRDAAKTGFFYTGLLAVYYL